VYRFLTVWIDDMCVIRVRKGPDSVRIACCGVSGGYTDGVVVWIVVYGEGESGEVDFRRNARAS